MKHIARSNPTIVSLPAAWDIGMCSRRKQQSVRQPCNQRRRTKRWKRLLFSLGALALFTGAFLFWANQTSVKAPAIPEPVSDAAIAQDVPDHGPEIRRFFVFQPPEAGREFVQLGNFSSFLLNPSVRDSSPTIIDLNGTEIPNWLFAQWLDLGGYVIVIEPMEKLFIHLALGLDRWHSRNSQIVTLQEFAATRAE